MPHQCTDCDETYADGSESVLSGCASCGGTTFQYVPPGVAQDDETDASTDPATRHLGGGVINVGEDDDPEDASQHSARTDIVDADELPNRTPDPSPGGDDTGEFEVDLDALRRELNRQFEGIHIVAPGHYELNLMELYRREECIITLHEDGRYAIGVPGDEDFSLDPDSG